MDSMLKRRLLAEFIGTMVLVCTVVGSGIMAERMTDDRALMLLGNTLPTGAILVVLITMLSPVSAHFNPVVTLAFRLQNAISAEDARRYVVVQILGGILGTMVAHAMFEGQPLLELSSTSRTGLSQWFAEIVATAGLVLAILTVHRTRIEALPMVVGLYITAAYWFTASTSFANPAVAIGRSLTDTFSGIYPLHVPMFILAQVIGAMIAFALMRRLYPD